MSEKSYLTKEKHEALAKELELLKTDKRREVAESLEYAKSLGDLSENAEYHEARALQAELEDKISKLENILRDAVIVSDSKHGEKAEIGSKITIEKEGAKERMTYNIVGSEESDLQNGKISSSSPLGAAILGKKKGDKISINTPKGAAKYTIIDVA
ncbi:MAG TPA: transcription elongation factor GreA [Candidatus Paceibacterota bacterium]